MKSLESKQVLSYCLQAESKGEVGGPSKAARFHEQEIREDQ